MINFFVHKKVLRHLKTDKKFKNVEIQIFPLLIQGEWIDFKVAEVVPEGKISCLFGLIFTRQKSS